MQYAIQFVIYMLIQDKRLKVIAMMKYRKAKRKFQNNNEVLD